MIPVDVIVPIITAIGGGGLVAAILKFVSTSKVDFYNRLMEDNVRLRAQEVQNSIAIKELDAKLDALQERFIMMDNANHSLPIPQWVKTTTGIILSMNSHCYKTFVESTGLSRLECIGLKDEDIFPKETADLIKLNDQKVINDKKTSSNIENILVNGRFEEWSVTRYPIFEDGTIVALGGIAYQCIDNE